MSHPPTPALSWVVGHIHTHPCTTPRCPPSHGLWVKTITHMTHMHQLHSMRAEVGILIFDSAAVLEAGGSQTRIHVLWASSGSMD